MKIKHLNYEIITYVFVCVCVFACANVYCKRLFCFNIRLDKTNIFIFNSFLGIISIRKSLLTATLIAIFFPSLYERNKNGNTRKLNFQIRCIYIRALYVNRLLKKRGRKNRKITLDYISNLARRHVRYNECKFLCKYPRQYTY